MKNIRRQPFLPPLTPSCCLWSITRHQKAPIEPVRYCRHPMRYSQVLSFFIPLRVCILPPVFLTLCLIRWTAVIAFLGAFVLVKYKLKEEKREHDDATESRVLKVWSANPRLVQVGGVRAKEVPTQLLSQTHSISVATGAIGFFFAMAGIMCNIWALQGRAATTLSSATLGTCIIVSLTVIKPLKRAESTIGMIEKGL